MQELEMKCFLCSRLKRENCLVPVLVQIPGCIQYSLELFNVPMLVWYFLAELMIVKLQG
jgi:hypothetical protein